MQTPREIQQRQKRSQVHLVGQSQVACVRCTTTMILRLQTWPLKFVCTHLLHVRSLARFGHPIRHTFSIHINAFAMRQQAKLNELSAPTNNRPKRNDLALLILHFSWSCALTCAKKEIARIRIDRRCRRTHEMAKKKNDAIKCSADELNEYRKMINHSPTDLLRNSILHIVLLPSCAAAATEKGSL